MSDLGAINNPGAGSGSGTVNNNASGTPLAVYTGAGTTVGPLGSTSITAYQGNGALVQLSTGTPTSGNLVKFDANGNVVDAGEAALPTQGFMFVISGGGTTTTGTVTINTTVLWAIMLNIQITTTKLGYWVQTADNSANLYDLGIYDSGGTLKLHLGATAGTSFAPSTGAKTMNWTGGGLTLPPAKYYFAMTGNAAVATLGGQGNVMSQHLKLAPSANSATAGGVLNNSVTPAADSFSSGAFPQIMMF